MVVARSARVSPFAGAPATPPRRASSASDWSTLFKMASSPHKIRFISIPWKGGPTLQDLRSLAGKIFPLNRPFFLPSPPPRPSESLRISPAPPSRPSIVQRPEVIDIDLEGCANIWPSFPRTTLSRVRGFKPPSRGGGA